MKSIRKPTLTARGTIAMTAAGSPAAHAQVLPPAALGLGLPSSTVGADSPCGTTVGQDVGGSAGSPRYGLRTAQSRDLR